jgi:Leucine-rich repeat (LRR) protein
VDSYRSLKSLDGLGHLTRLESLRIASTKRPMSLRPIERFAGLRSLFVEGPHRDYDAIASLTALEDLTLRSVTLPDLSVLVPLARLRSLDIKLGGTRDLALLPRIGRLEYLELWMIRGLDNVSAVAEVETLQHLFLQALRQVDRLPSFAGATVLRRVDLDTMKGLTDLAPLAEAPTLEILNLVAMRHADPEVLRPFVGHPTLRAGIWGFGSDRKNFAAQDLLPLPPEPYRYAEVRRGETITPDSLPWDAPDWRGFRSAGHG